MGLFVAEPRQHGLKLPALLYSRDLALLAVYCEYLDREGPCLKLQDLSYAGAVVAKSTLPSTVLSCTCLLDLHMNEFVLKTAEVGLFGIVQCEFRLAVLNSALMIVI